MGAKYEIVTITTPAKNLLSGLWYSPTKPRRVIIFIHDLTASSFSLEKVFSALAYNNTAILKLHNRGHDIVSKLNKVDKRRKKGYRTSKIAGAGHEIFTECVDDIQGAVEFAKDKGNKEIFLVGHSTGCQKSIYYLSRRGKQKQIRGVILLCPISDYAAAVHLTKPEILKKAQNYAKKLIKSGKSSELLPQDVWEEIVDAQRFLSLYSPDSEEEIFTYAQSIKKPLTLPKVKIPTLVIYAGDDEYRDRPTKKIKEWFIKNSKSKDLNVKQIENAPHSFQGYEKEVVKEIQKWLTQR